MENTGSRKIKRALLQWGLISFLVAGMVRLTRSFTSLQYPLYVLGILLIMGSTLLQGAVTFSKKVTGRLWSLLLLLFSVVSSVALTDWELAVDCFVLWVLHFVFIEVMPRDRAFPHDLKRMFTWLLIFFLLASVLSSGLKLTNYLGFTYNLNSFGQLSCMFFTFFFADFARDRVYQLKKLPLILLTFFMVTISSSRGAFVTMVALILIWVFSIVWENRRKTKIIKICLVALLLILVGVAIYCFTPVGSIIYDSIIEKFIRKSSNISSDRFDIWERVYREVTLWGHGRRYFDTFPRAAHNTFISILGQYGIMGLIAYMGLIVAFTATALRYAGRKKDILPLLFVVSYILLSLIEGMLMKSNMFMMYYAVGYCVCPGTPGRILEVLPGLALPSGKPAPH